jgi:putative Holliday junction resolvase
MNGKILALDFGLKRTGIAITDELCICASPLDTIDSSILTTYLKTLMTKENIQTIVIGEPKRLDGRDTHITQNTHLLQKSLQNQFPEVNIYLYDERFTSKMASQTLLMGGAKKKQRQNVSLIDKVSAAILLQSFLTYHSSSKKS